MNRNYFDKIEDYLSGLMNEVEKADFETELAQDKALAEEFAQQQLVWKAMHLLAVDDMRSKVSGWMAEEAGQEAAGAPQAAKIVQMRPRAMRVLSIAASLLLLICAGTWWWANSVYDSQRLASQYYEIELIGTKGPKDDVDENYTAGIAMHYDGNWAGSAEALLKVPVSSPDYCYSQIMAADGYYRFGKYQEALALLDKLKLNQACKDTKWPDKAKWQSVLVRFAMGDTGNETMKLLDEVISTQGGNKKAKELKQKTQSFWWNLIN